MDDEDVQHWQRLIVEYTRHLRILEEKVAGYGRLECPPHILKSAEDAKREIKELEQRIRRRIRRTEDGTILYSAEEVDELYDRIVRIGQLEHAIPLLESTVQTLKSAFYRKYQSKKAKFLVSAIFILVFSPALRVILQILFEPLWLVDNFPLRLLIAFLLIVFCGILMYFLIRKLGELYGEIEGLEKKLQEDKDELQVQKNTLGKTYGLSK